MKSSNKASKAARRYQASTDPDKPQGAPGWRVLLLLLAGLVAGWLARRTQRYLQRILQQPLYTPLPLPDGLSSEAALTARAYAIAAANLRACIEWRRLPGGGMRGVLSAGRRHFREPWARDLGFSVFGLMELNENAAARDSLQSFLDNQRPNGELPIKLHASSALERYLHALLGREQPIQTPLRPRYGSAHGSASLDSSALLVIAGLYYARHGNDPAFLEHNWPAMKRTAAWLSGFASSPQGLLVQGPFSDWADSVARRGAVLYTNLLYWKMLHELGRSAAELGEADEGRRLQTLATRQASAIQAHFWRPAQGYFVTSKQFPNLGSGGNLLAIAWGLATPEQAGSILERMHAFSLADPVPTRAAYPAYPTSSIAIENRLGGVAYYHTAAAWLWLGAWHAIAACCSGQPELARNLLERMAQVVVRDGAVHEVYRPDGQAVAGFWYTSEVPLAWSAAMLIYAERVTQRCLTGQAFSAEF